MSNGVSSFDRVDIWCCVIGAATHNAGIWTDILGVILTMRPFPIAQKANYLNFFTQVVSDIFVIETGCTSFVVF